LFVQSHKHRKLLCRDTKVGNSAAQIVMRFLKRAAELEANLIIKAIGDA
jgi:hypothetical protein